MKRPAFFRRRELWLPTLWGWAALLLCCGALAVAFVRSIHGFLAQRDPAGARVLVVEGWMGPEELDEAIALFRARGYERVVTTGGPIRRWPPSPGPSSYAEQAAQYLREHGVPQAALSAVPARGTSRDRTYSSAVAVREWARISGMPLDAIDLISDGPHARRSRLLYQLALGPETRVGVLATRSYDYDAANWWRSSIGVKNVIEQAIDFAWVKCCFRAGG